MMPKLLPGTEKLLVIVKMRRYLAVLKQLYSWILIYSALAAKEKNRMKTKSLKLGGFMKLDIQVV